MNKCCGTQHGVTIGEFILHTIVKDILQPLYYVSWEFILSYSSYIKYNS